MALHIANLPSRGIIEISGEDKASFLQGLITNDINLVTPERAIYATLLNPQGRFLYDFFIAEYEGSYILDCEAERLDSLIKKLTLYKLRSQVTLTPRPDLQVYAAWGEGVILQEFSFMDPRLSELGFRVLGNVTPNATFEAYDLHRISLGVPEGGRDLIPEKSILLEFGLDELGAISWTKGCYVGQELIARTKHVGQVRKRVFPVKIEGDVQADQDEIMSGETPVGTLLSRRETLGLAHLRIEALRGELTCGEIHLKPYALSWMKINEE